MSRTDDMINDLILRLQEEVRAPAKAGKNDAKAALELAYKLEAAYVKH